MTIVGIGKEMGERIGKNQVNGFPILLLLLTIPDKNEIRFVVFTRGIFIQMVNVEISRNVSKDSTDFEADFTRMDGYCMN